VAKPRVIYFINGLGRGGAELGLRTMLEHDLFAKVDLRVIAICRGSAGISEDVAHRLGHRNVIEGGVGAKLTFPLVLKSSYNFLYHLINFRPNVVVLSLKQANIIGRFILFFFPSIHCVAFEHIVRLERGRASKIYERALRLLSNRVDEVWGDCYSTLNSSQIYYRKTPKTKRFVPLFVVSGSEPQKLNYDLHSPIRVAAASRLVTRKKLDVLLKAVRQLVERGRATELIIFGDGPDRTRLEDLTAALGLNGVVTFAGFVDEWWRVALNSDVFVHLSEEEGFCITVAEAMMVGLPVIASSVGGVRDYSKNLSDARHIQSLDPTDVAKEIEILLNDHDGRAELGRRAARSIRTQFASAAVRVHYNRIASTFATPGSE
jgi:glycosyltransferase involved in cell wall biosynthesis